MSGECRSLHDRWASSQSPRLSWRVSQCSLRAVTSLEAGSIMRAPNPADIQSRVVPLERQRFRHEDFHVFVCRHAASGNPTRRMTCVTTRYSSDYGRCRVAPRAGWDGGLPAKLREMPLSNSDDRRAVARYLGASGCHSVLRQRGTDASVCQFGDCVPDRLSTECHCGSFTLDNGCLRDYRRKNLWSLRSLSSTFCGSHQP